MQVKREVYGSALWYLSLVRYFQFKEEILLPIGAYNSGGGLSTLGEFWLIFTLLINSFFWPVNQENLPRCAKEKRRRTTPPIQLTCCFPLLFRWLNGQKWGINLCYDRRQSNGCKRVAALTVGGRNNRERWCNWQPRSLNQHPKSSHHRKKEREITNWISSTYNTAQKCWLDRIFLNDWWRVSQASKNVTNSKPQRSYAIRLYVVCGGKERLLGNEAWQL